MASLIKIRRDTAANWQSVNPTLSSGEQGLETDTGKLKYGDGSTAWNLLAYAHQSASVAISSSYALTASYALNGGGGGGGTVTSVTTGDGLSGGVITTAGTVSLNTSSLHFTDGIKNKLNTDGVISSSLQINTGSFTGSFRGIVLGTSSVATSASYALTASYALNGGGGSGAGFPYTGTAVITGSLIVSSSGINVIGNGISGSFTGSLVGAFIGTSSWASSASIATSASLATTASYIAAYLDISNGLDVTGSFNVLGDTLIDSATTTVSASTLNVVGSTFTIRGSSLTYTSTAFTTASKSIRLYSNAVLTGSLILSTSVVPTTAYAPALTIIGDTAMTGSLTLSSSAATELLVIGNSILSGSLNVTQGITGSLSGSVTSASYALTASYALNGGGGGSGTVTSITAGDGLNGGTITTAGTISINTSSAHFTNGVKEKLNTDNIVSSSTQFTSLTAPFTGSFTGSFTGNGAGLTGITRREYFGKFLVPGSSSFVFWQPSLVLDANDLAPQTQVLIYSASGTAINRAFTTLAIPSSYATGSTIGLRWKTTATTGDVIWRVDYAAVADGESFDPSAWQNGFAVTGSAPATTRLLTGSIIQLAHTDLSPNDMVIVSIARDRSGAADTLAANAELIDAYFQYVGN